MSPYCWLYINRHTMMTATIGVMYDRKNEVRANVRKRNDLFSKLATRSARDSVIGTLTPTIISVCHSELQKYLCPKI